MSPVWVLLSKVSAKRERVEKEQELLPPPPSAVRNPTLHPPESCHTAYSLNINALTVAVRHYKGQPTRQFCHPPYLQLTESPHG